MLKTKILLILYILATLLHIAGVLSNEHSMSLLFKPLIMPILMVFYVLSTSKINYWLLVALFFSFLGDVFLLFKGELYFILGLGSFLLAHVVYIKIIIDHLDGIDWKKFILAAFPFLGFLAVFFYVLGNNLGKMLVPVVVYGLTISIFGTFALYYYKKNKTSKTLMLLFGACIFIASDATIAIDKFYYSSEYFTIFIMVTYVLAQYLICRALIVRPSVS